MCCPLLPDGKTCEKKLVLSIEAPVLEIKVKLLEWSRREDDKDAFREIGLCVTDVIRCTAEIDNTQISLVSASCQF